MLEISRRTVIGTAVTVYVLGLGAVPAWRLARVWTEHELKPRMAVREIQP